MQPIIDWNSIEFAKISFAELSHYAKEYIHLLADKFRLWEKTIGQPRDTQYYFDEDIVCQQIEKCFSKGALKDLLLKYQEMETELMEIGLKVLANEVEAIAAASTQYWNNVVEEDPQRIGLVQSDRTDNAPFLRIKKLPLHSLGRKEAMPLLKWQIRLRKIRRLLAEVVWTFLYG
jgi:hypothetical protein